MYSLPDQVVSTELATDSSIFHLVCTARLILNRTFHVVLTDFDAPLIVLQLSVMDLAMIRRCDHERKIDLDVRPMIFHEIGILLNADTRTAQDVAMEFADLPTTDHEIVIDVDTGTSLPTVQDVDIESCTWDFKDHERAMDFCARPITDQDVARDLLIVDRTA